MALVTGSLLFWATMTGLTFLVTASDSNTIISEEEANRILAERLAAQNKINLSSVNGTPDFTGQKSLRWPDVAYNKNTDFVFFEFGQYVPPFKDRGNSDENGYEAYQKSNQITDAGAKSIILPMPQDLSSIIEQNWSGKQFSRAGVAAISALTGAGLADLNRSLNDGGSINALRGALTAGALNKIPGVGGNLTINDITGSTQGIVLNPNAELLYEQPDLREVQMTFKMVPRNATEAKSIYEITKLFRFASVPAWGSGNLIDTQSDKVTLGEGDDATEVDNINRLMNKRGDGKKGETNVKENFIQVPWLCNFRFMTGGDLNKNIPQYKVCAISRVSVSHTPDGTYATYQDGTPLATEIQLNFLETKAIFKRDILGNYN